MAVSAPPAGLGTELTPPARAGVPDAAPPAGAPRAPAITALYPILLAVFPALSVAATTVGTYRVEDLLLILAIVAGLAAVAIVVCAAAVRLLGRDHALARGALVAAVGVAWFYYFIPLQEVVAGPARPLARSAVLGPICLVPSAALIWLAVRRRWTLGGAGRFLTLAGALLVAFSAVRVTRANLAARELVARSAMWRQASAPVPMRPALAREPKRDIYLLILDGYPNATVLRTKFGYDNTPFLDSLRALGFTIPTRVRSNYTSTILSVSSMLNFEHVTPLARDLRPDDGDYTIPTTLIRNNRTVRFLRERGYRYLLFPTEWSEPTRYSPLADYVYPGPERVALFAETQRSELRRVVIGSTLLSKFPAARRGYGGDFILDEFRLLRDVPSRREPTFAFAHFLLPHQPIVLDGQCRPRNSDRMVVGERMGTPGRRGEFLGAVRCANTQVLGLVTELLRRSAVAPIIIVVGDHGTLSNGWPIDRKASVETVAAERLAPLGAFYMPDGGAEMFRDSVTHVNVFRNVLRHYFGADLPPVSNDGYLNQATEPFLFRPVDERTVIGG